MDVSGEIVDQSKAAFAGLIELEKLGEDDFRTHGGPANYTGNVFGGQLMAQALWAACQTAPGYRPASMHCYFVASGSTVRPMNFVVERLRQGRSFAHRSVSVRQDGSCIFVLNCLLQAQGEGFEHQMPSAPDVPGPDDIEWLADFARREADRLSPAAKENFLREALCEIRPVDPASYFFDRPEWAERDIWFRMAAANAVDDEALHACLIAYNSDLWLGGVCAIPHMVPTNTERLRIISLDHSIWFHRPARADEWLLHHTESPSASDGRGLARGLVFDRQGRLVASTAQEVAMRPL